MEVCRLAHMFCHMLTSEEHTRNTLGTHSMEVCRLAHMFCHMLTSEEHTRNTLGTHSMEVCRLAHMFCHMLTSYLTTPLSAWSVCAAKMDKNATECTRVRAALPRDTCVSTNRQCVCV